MNTQNTPHKWHLLVYFVSKHVTKIVVTIKLFPLINFLLSQLKYLMRLTYTLLVISLHKINMLVSFSAPLNTRPSVRSSERQRIFLQRHWQGGQSEFWRSRRRRCERTVMGTPSFQPFLKSYWLTPVKWLANCREACDRMQYWRARGSIKCGARDNYVRIWYWTPLSWTSSEHGDLRDVSFPLSGNRGYDSNRRSSLSSFHETSRRISPLWERYSIPPWERLRAACTS